MEGYQPPELWLVSRICEEYHCLPSQAIQELWKGPSQLVLDIMELRAYAQAKSLVERGGELPASPIVKEVLAVQETLGQWQAEGRI